MPVLDICEIEADLEKNEAATMMTIFSHVNSKGDICCHATRVPIRSAQKPSAVFPPSQWWYTWNLIKIVQVALEIYIFEIPIDPNAKIDKSR